MSPPAARVLIAGIGNVFFGDDGFGVAVVQRLRPDTLPPGVEAHDYGIRGVHLAYDVLDADYSTLILVDAAPLDAPPGTLAVLDVTDNDGDASDATAVDAHTMTPAAVIHGIRSLGGDISRVLVVACQPASFDIGMSLSEPVLAAIDDAVALTRDLAVAEASLLCSSRRTRAG